MESKALRWEKLHTPHTTTQLTWQTQGSLPPTANIVHHNHEETDTRLRCTLYYFSPIGSDCNITNARRHHSCHHHCCHHVTAIAEEHKPIDFVVVRASGARGYDSIADATLFQWHSYWLYIWVALSCTKSSTATAKITERLHLLQNVSYWRCDMRDANIWLKYSIVNSWVLIWYCTNTIEEQLN